MTYLAKIGELTLKGSNIKEFENLLKHNAAKYIEGLGCNITLRAGRLYIDCDESAAQRVEFMLSHLIGITGWAKAAVCEKTIEDINRTVFEIAKKEAERGCKTFKIDARRSDKNFPLNSYQICCEAAGDVEAIMKVDVHKPDTILYVEVRERVFVFADSNIGCRGLPVGSSGKGLLLLSGGLDSPVAGYRMLRRGMKIECCYFHSYPYTSEEAKQKVVDLAQKLAYYGITTYLNVIPFTEVQMRIKERAPDSWSTLMLRVCMMKLANRLARRCNAKCIITGESVGQVASQTIENMTVTEHFAEFPLLRPLCGMDKEEIIRDSYFIGTYDISILPYEDCCVLFSPRHPVLRATSEEAEKIYSSLEVEQLIDKAYKEREIIKLSVYCAPTKKTV
ncbi:tRNA uracil 4-sulfurtransferase ThiI [Treponema sp. Marseille-Q3903]|uniref:tRNA uracil 4-sulfurtransferase ThiI n=1 Tax=Treponema sp. Marseille-Q3903 TaxID=2766703 RepID=UPI00165275D1|nr:tRNA uracil 4-sulfurtransferase ThiI [Treponema sp. Marseille-Q3903]MBC6713734.1 tRNA 4-thiouridine(8) synthase ThiI [Treponema sp. Marseille-Q3903]